MSRLLRTITFSVLPVLALGCGESHPGYFGTVSPKHDKDILWLNNGAEPQWTDPGKCADSNGGDVIWNTFAGLVEAHPATLAPMPDIASDWEMSEDGLTYTFYLRESKWSDGTPLTAEDFEWSWKRLLDPKTGSKYAYIAYLLKNAEPFNGRALLLTGVDATTPLETIQTFVNNVPPVEQIRPSTSSTGFVIEVAGDDDGERQKNRESLVAALDGKELDGRSVTLAITDGSIHLTGTAEETTQEAVEKFLRQALPIEKVKPSDSPPGFFIYVGGEEEQRASNRDALVEALEGQSFGMETVHIEPVTSDLVGVQAVDEFTLVASLESSVPYFIDLLSFYSFMPVPRHVIERLEEEGKNPDLWTRPEYLVCNGAYVMTKWKFRQYMEFEKNEHYWNAEKTRTPKVRAQMVESYNTSLNLYKTGEIDFPGGNTSLPAEFMDYLSTHKDYRLDPYLGAYFYWFNTKKPPMDNVKVRQALALSVDREAIVTHITRAGQAPTATIVPDGLGGYRGPVRSLFDPERARQLLAEAGYPDGNGLPEITLIYNTSEGHKQIAEAVQQMWKANLNIHVNIENQEWKVYLKKLEMMDFQMARMGWIGDYVDPYTFLDLFLPTSGNNHSGWSDERYADMLAEANPTLDRQKRLELLADAEAYMLSNQPVLPIYVYTRSQMIKPYIRGLWGNYQDRHQWKYMWIDERWYDGVPSTPADDEPPAPIPRVRPSRDGKVATTAR